MKVTAWLMNKPTLFEFAGKMARNCSKIPNSIFIIKEMFGENKGFAKNA